MEYIAPVILLVILIIFFSLLLKSGPIKTSAFGYILKTILILVNFVYSAIFSIAIIAGSGWENSSNSLVPPVLLFGLALLHFLVSFSLIYFLATNRKLFLILGLLNISPLLILLFFWIPPRIFELFNITF